MRRALRLLIPAISLSLIAPAVASALDPAKAPTQYVQKAWTDVEGLPQSFVQDIVQTRDGYLWLGTQEGLVRFDGERFSVFETGTTSESGSDSVLALHEDRERRLWAALDAPHVATLDRGEVRFYPVPPETFDGVPFALAEDRDGRVWVGTARGLCRVEGTSPTCLTQEGGLPGRAVYSLLSVPDGRLWIGTERGLAVGSDGEFRELGPELGLPRTRVNCLVEDERGLWIGTASGLFRLEEGSVRGPVSGISVEILDLLVDREGSLWVGTNGAGLFRVREGGSNQLNAPEELAHAVVSALLEDREGSLWIGTRGSGLIRLSDGPVTPFGAPEGLLGEIAFAVDGDSDGTVWVGTDSGLSRIGEGGVISTFSAEDGMRSPFVSSLSVDEASGTVWIGTQVVDPDGSGLYRFRDETFESRGGPVLERESTWSLAPGGGGALWVGSIAGLFRMSSGNLERVRHEGDGREISAHTLLQGANGVLWIGARDGLYRVRDGQVEYVDLRPDPDVGEPTVIALHEDSEGSLWIGTYKAGLYRLRGERIDHVTVREGLFDDSAYALLEDDAGHLWMSSNRGISRIAKSEIEELFSGTRTRVEPLVLGLPDGMRTIECNGGFGSTAWKGPDGRLWFVTVRGVVAVDPTKLGGNPTPPLLAIESVLADRESVAVRDGVRLGPGVRKLEIRYAALSFLKPDRVRYRYRLEGFDADWVEAGGDRAAVYTNLSPGRYRFRVKAENGDGVWNQEGADFAFELAPYFHQTGWFQGLTVLLLVSLAVAGHRLRSRYLVLRAERLERTVRERTLELRQAVREAAILDERNRIAQDLHDSLSQGLAAVVVQLEAARSWSRDASEPVRKGLAEASRAAKECLEESKRSVRALVPRALERMELPEALEDLACETSSSGLRVEARRLGPERPIPKPTQLDLYRIAQEAIGNALRHAEATRVEILLEWRPGVLVLSVEDDGRGMVGSEDQAGSGEGGMGLAGMRRRARDLGGSLTVEERSEGGVRIRVEVPDRRPEAAEEPSK